MLRLKYSLLGLSLIALAIGFSNGQGTVIYLGLPVGTILFGLFLVTQVLEKEWALYDKQSCAPRQPHQPCIEQQRKTIPQEVAHHPALTKACPH